MRSRDEPSILLLLVYPRLLSLAAATISIPYSLIPRVCFQKHKSERKAKEYANLEKNQKENRESMSNITHEVSHMKRIIRRYELTDAEWKRLQPYFPERQMGDKGRPRREPREMLNGIFWIARSGAAWRDLPDRYGPWQTVYKRFKEWSESGLIEKIFHELGEDADLQDISIDSTYIKAHKASAGAERGGSQNPLKP